MTTPDESACKLLIIHVDVPHYILPSGERVAAFERVLEVPPGEADKLSNAMKYYKKMGYIRAHRRLYGLVKKYHHKDKVHSIATCTCMSLLMHVYVHVHVHVWWSRVQADIGTYECPCTLIKITCT